MSIDNSYNVLCVIVPGRLHNGRGEHGASVHRIPLARLLRVVMARAPRQVSSRSFHVETELLE